MMMKFVSVILLAFVVSPALAQFDDGAWSIRREEWTADDETSFSSFVRAMGRTKCSNVDQCIRQAANPYNNTDNYSGKFYSDCADFPYFLRSYYAWKNNLPFGYVVQVSSYDAIERKKNPPVLAEGEVLKPLDNRYSDLGNFPVSRVNLVPGKKELNFFREAKRLQDIVSSAMLRLGPDIDGKVQSDFYSPEIKLGSIRPGTVLYDPNGHVAVIYDVLPDGRLLYMDAHPDNSVTRGVFSVKFARSKPAQGAGFKNFRPMKLVGAKRDFFTDELTGGQVVVSKNSEIPDASRVQYEGTNPDPTDWRKGTFTLRGKTIPFHEFVRASLATEKINPVVEFDGALKELCEDFKERADSVDAATKKSIHQQPHPPVLPANLFGSEGDWENYSTPGRDTRLRASFLDLKKNAEERYTQWRNNDFSDMQYAGTDLKRDLLRAFHQVNMDCSVKYTNSAGKVTNLGFELAIARLFKMSFDPYHCPERRWGASHPEELKACPDDAAKVRWYNAEQSIRNFLQRDWSAAQAITVEELESGRLGSAAAPEVNLRKFLDQLPAKGTP